MNKTSIAFISAGMVSGTSCLTVGALAVSGKISLAAFGMTSTLLGPIGIAVGILLLLISAWSLLKGMPHPASTDVQGNKTVVAASKRSRPDDASSSPATRNRQESADEPANTMAETAQQSQVASDDTAYSSTSSIDVEPDSLNRTATDRTDEQVLSKVWRAFGQLKLSTPMALPNKPDTAVDNLLQDKPIMTDVPAHATRFKVIRPAVTSCALTGPIQAFAEGGTFSMPRMVHRVLQSA